MSTEAEVIKQLELAAPRYNMRLFRNNVGAYRDQSGRLIRYGLANNSAQLNKQVKSSDLIGIKQVTITPDMVGKTIGVFVSIEAKAPGWIYHGTEREMAQQRWIDFINNMGGVAYFSTGEIK